MISNSCPASAVIKFLSRLGGDQISNGLKGFALPALLALALPCALQARTIALKAEDIDRVAAITEQGPRYSWAAYEGTVGMFRNAPQFCTPQSGFLIHYPLDKIPKGQHISLAELTIPVALVSPPQARLYFWRILVDWGVGVCNQFRMIRPTKEAWTVPGARGNSTDRATKPSTVIGVPEVGEKSVNLTQDVELWYTGAAPNHGWLISVEDKDTAIQLQSPIYDGTASWELRITYEPQ